MSTITLVPSDQSVTIDGQAAFGVDFTGIDPDIHAIVWRDTQGVINFNGDPITGEVVPNQVFTSLTPYQGYIDQAVLIIDRYNNPIEVYSTLSGLVWDGATYQLGDLIFINTYGVEPPLESTSTAPPVLSDGQSLHWFENSWVACHFNPSLSLSEVKENLITIVKRSAASNTDHQARIYSALQLNQSADPGALPTADYAGVDLATYQGYQDAEVVTLVNEVNAALTNAALYSFSPYVSPEPPTP